MSPRRDKKITKYFKYRIQLIFFVVVENPIRKTFILFHYIVYYSFLKNSKTVEIIKKNTLKILRLHLLNY